MILDNASSHVVSFAKVDKFCGFSTLELSNMNLVFLPPNVISIVQPLDQGIIASSKIQWVLSLFDDATLKDPSRNFASGSTKNQQKSVGRGCYLGRVDLDTM